MEILIYRNSGPVLPGSTAPTFSADQLSRIASAYSPCLHEAPVCVNSPAHDAPAFGWVQALRATPDSLFAELQQVYPAFDAMRRAGKFPQVSTAFYPPDSPSNPVPGVWYLRHVAFLGAEAPGVKGLRVAQFSDREQGVLTFNFFEGNYNMSTRTQVSHGVLPAGAAVAPDRLALHEKISSYAEANGIDYGSAATLVERDARQGPASYTEPADAERADLHRKIELYAAKYGISYEAACSALVAAMRLKIQSGSMPANLPPGAAVDPTRAAMHNKIASHAEAKGIDYATALSELSHTLGA